MKIRHTRNIVFVLLISLFVCSCSVSKRSNRKSLADKVEKRNRKKPQQTEQPKPPKPQKPVPKGKLMDYCEDWLGTPYRGGGETKQGVDCSGFVSNVYRDVYGIKLPRRSLDMESACQKTSKKDLREGDLVFFNNKPNGKTNHVGIFLDKDRFIHASTSKGVTISRFDEKYWAERFRCGGKHPARK